MKITTKLCYMSDQDIQFQRLGIDKKNKEKYAESNFTFDLREVTGIDSPTDGDPERFVIFLKGTNGLLIKHNYKTLLEQWKNLP